MNKILVGQLAFIKESYDVIGVSSFVEKDFNEIQEREGITMISIPFSRTINLKKDFVSLFKLIQLFRKERPDIVHTHTPKAGLLGMIAAKITRVPARLHTLGGMPLMEVQGTKRKILEFTEKLTYKCAHKVYPNSKGLKDFILDNKFTSTNKVKVFGNGSSNGIDVEFYKKDYVGSEQEIQGLKLELGIEPNDFVYMFLGRLAKDKGIVELINAFEKVKVSKPEAKLLLVGPMEAENSSLSEETRNIILNSPSIIYPGRTDNVRAFLNLADVFVFPSYREGFPNVLLQAGAMELPIIATNINGCNEIIIDGETGLLVPMKDENALCEKMNIFYSNEELRRSASLNVRRSTEEKFAQKLIWEEIKNEYDFYTKK